MQKYDIITLATPLNKFGEEPDTGALSQLFANPTKYIFGFDLPAQSPDYSKVSQPRIVTDALIERVVLFINQKQTALSRAANSTQSLSSSIRGTYAMPDNHLNIAPIEGQTSTCNFSQSCRRGFPSGRAGLFYFAVRK